MPRSRRASRPKPGLPAHMKSGARYQCREEPRRSYWCVLPEVGRLERRQIDSLAGPVPCDRDAGCTKGKARIGGGRKSLRDALYIPALVAAIHKPDLKARCDALCAVGRPKNPALRRTHAKAHRTHQCPRQKPQAMDPEARLIKTDTPWSRREAGEQEEPCQGWKTESPSVR